MPEKQGWRLGTCASAAVAGTPLAVRPTIRSEAEHLGLYVLFPDKATAAPKL